MNAPLPAPPVPLFPFGAALHDPETGWSCRVAVACDRARIEAGVEPAYLLASHAVGRLRVEVWSASAAHARFRPGDSPDPRMRPSPALWPSSFAVDQRLVHRKGGNYRVLFAPDTLVFADGRPAYAYIAWGEETVAPLWVRPAFEMEDGRFAPFSS